MSDSVVISTDFEKRGAIAVGDYYCNNSIAFGKGMVDAYICQENYSIYPRIILSTDIVKKLFDSSYKDDKLCLDEDGYYDAKLAE